MGRSARRWGCAASVPGPRNALHRSKRWDPDFDAGARGQRSERARRKPNRRRQHVGVGCWQRFVAQPVREGQHDLPSLRRIDSITSAHTLGLKNRWIHPDGGQAPLLRLGSGCMRAQFRTELDMARPQQPGFRPMFLDR